MMKNLRHAAAASLAVAAVTAGSVGIASQSVASKPANTGKPAAVGACAHAQANLDRAQAKLDRLTAKLSAVHGHAAKDIRRAAKAQQKRVSHFAAVVATCGASTSPTDAPTDAPSDAPSA